MTKQLKNNAILAVICLAFLGAMGFPLLASTSVHAQQSTTCDKNAAPDPNKPCLPNDPVKPTPDPATNKAQLCKSNSECTATKILSGNSIVTNYVNPLINTLTVVVGIVIAISLVMAGIQYSGAGGDPSKIAEAKKKIMNSIIALLAFLFMGGFIQWLLPGGII